MLFNRLLVFLGGVIIFALGLLLVATALHQHHNGNPYADIIRNFLVSCDCIWPTNAAWYGALGAFLMVGPVLYVANLWAAWRRRRFWQLLMGPNVVSLDLKPLERALRNQLETEEDIEAAKMRLVVPEFGRNRLIGVMALTIAEQPNLNRRVEELRSQLVEQVRAMLPELKLELRVRIRLATRLDARLFAPPPRDTETPAGSGL
ncbi:MAG: hypothetical protein ACREJ2_18825 [Planctomycetota bacterium]